MRDVYADTSAAGIIGVNRVVNAAPDGYTFLFGSIGVAGPNHSGLNGRAIVSIERMLTVREGFDDN